MPRSGSSAGPAGISVLIGAPLLGLVASFFCLASLFAPSPMYLASFIGLYMLTGYLFGLRSSEPLTRIVLGLTLPFVIVLLAVRESSWLWIASIAGVAGLVAAAAAGGRRAAKMGAEGDT